MGDEAFSAVGRIIKTHGLQGEVSVKSYIEASLDVLTGMSVWFVPPASVRTSQVRNVRPGPKGPLVKFDGIDSAEDARPIVGCEILVRTDGLPEDLELEAGPEEAIGTKVVDSERGLLGEVVDVIVTGANDVWVVNGPFGEVLIPVIDDVVISFDEHTSTANVRLLPGLIDWEEGSE